MEEPKPAPKISVLIVSYNCAEALRRCLAAIEASQERETIQVIVVDRGSRDESPRLDIEFPDTSFLRLPRNFGQTKAWNIGIRTATGELVLFLSPYVEVRPETIATLARVLESDPAIGATCPLLRTPDGAVASIARPVPTPEMLYRAWRADAPLTGPPVTPNGTDPIPVEFPLSAAIMVWRRFVQGMNYFDERYGHFGADWELCFQLRSAGKKVLVLPDAPATLYPEPVLDGAGAKGVLSADRALAVAAYAGKRNGFITGLRYRLTASLTALGGIFGGKYGWTRFRALAAGQKIDGSQGEL
jgi:GT2 family glycosyltransferase